VKLLEPEVVIHLGARTDLKGQSVEDYEVNTLGTSNLIDVLSTIPTVKKVLFASSRLVCKIDHIPASMVDYSATTCYGISKVQGEMLVREKCRDADYDWLIFRPTSIWGPWFDEPYKDFFDLVIKGRYVHPRGILVSKSFGYVGNSVFLLEKMIHADNKLLGKTLYLSDTTNLDVLSFANEIRRLNNQSDICEVPYFFLFIAALIGTTMSLIGFSRVPLTMFRLNNLITTMIYNVDDLKQFCDPLPFDQTTGIRKTLEWMNSVK
jgi:nucleoside-diphosphate-sugar epimerase